VGKWGSGERGEGERGVGKWGSGEVGRGGQQKKNCGSTLLLLSI